MLPVAATVIAGGQRPRQKTYTLNVRNNVLYKVEVSVVFMLNKLTVLRGEACHSRWL